MASRKEYEMLFQLDAKLGSSYTSTFSKAKSGPSELQKEIRSLQSVQADISAYTKQQAAVEKTQAKLDNLNKQYQLLQQEIKETSGPTTSLERESAKLEQRIGDTSNALAAQKEKLGATAKSLNETGVGTDNLGSKSQDLADKLNTLRAKEEAAAESAEEYGDKGTSSIEAVSQAFAAAKVYEGLEQIKDAYMQYAETVQAEDAYPASAAQPAAEAAAFAPAEADKVDIPLDGQTPENGLSAAEMNHAAEADAMLADYTAVISPRAVDAMGSFAAQNAKPAAEAVQAESAKSSTTTQLQPMSLSPVFQISGMQDSQQLRSALNQSVEDMRQMILDVVQSARDDEERMNFS